MNLYEAMRLAPSTTNSQPCFFVCEQGKIHTYQKKLNPLQVLVYKKMNEVDMGIVICHELIATEAKGKQFIFSMIDGVEEVKGYHYRGIVG